MKYKIYISTHFPSFLLQKEGKALAGVRERGGFFFYSRIIARLNNLVGQAFTH
jgi:hypothetical protein